MAASFSHRLRGAAAFLHHEAAGGVMLVAAAVLALIASNSALHDLYSSFLHVRLGIHVGDLLVINKPLLLWINDGLMAIFFFLVGLEIKRELLQGELSTIRQAALPIIAAIGGMVVPALIYVFINWGDAAALKGWAIPAATDIAFAVGVLALLGSRVPVALKIFLLALAIIDDLGAIIIIALFYTEHLSLVSLLLALIGMVILLALNASGVTRLAPYVLTGIAIWVCVLKSGVHATLAGVVVALAIPLVSRSEDEPSLLEQIEENLHPWVAFGVLPLFAFANAGVSLSGITLAAMTESIPLGIAAGLVLGKTIGIFGATWFAVVTGMAIRPAGATWPQILGVAMLGGIGFTMSLFIGMLAFQEPAQAAALRVGVLMGSIISGLAGYLTLAASSAPAHVQEQVSPPRRARPE